MKLFYKRKFQYRCFSEKELRQRKMSVNSFADAQKSHNTIYPKFSGVVESNEECIPFVKLLDGKESSEILEKRWQLYHQLHSTFHSQVDNILANIETDLKNEISGILLNNNDEPRKRKACFKTLFLIGSDSTTEIGFPNIASNTEVNTLIDLTPKESPNVRMMLRRSMFKLFSQTDEILHNNNNSNNNNEEELPKTEEDLETNDIGDVEEGQASATSYDLTLVENFKILFKRNLNMVFNFKDVDSFNFTTLNDFIVLLKSALKNEHVRINLVFHINTNLSNIEQNLNQSTLRLLKRKYHTLDVSSNKGFKYGNRIFQSFLDTVDGKLNLSQKFVKFVLDKMANNTNHNLKLLTRILDFSLMSYFYQSPFSIFIDPVNISFLKKEYLELLTHCPTFMFFIDGLTKEEGTREDITNLLTNRNGTLEDFFIEFLVRDNPINGHAKLVANFLEETLHITNFNFIELYYSLLKGTLNVYLEKWPECKEHTERLSFEPIDTMFQELFTLDNNTGLLTQALFPSYKSNLEDDLLSWERVLPMSSIIHDNSIDDIESLRVLNDSVGPMISEMFKLYREANPVINLYDFYVALRESLPEEQIMNFLIEQSAQDEALKKFLTSSDKAFEKTVLIFFMQALTDLEHIGVIKQPTSKKTDVIEKGIWKGI